MSTFGLRTHAQVVRFVGRSKLTQRSASDTQMGSLRHRRASGYILLSRTGENVISAACLVRVSLFRYHIVVILNLQTEPGYSAWTPGHPFPSHSYQDVNCPFSRLLCPDAR